MKTASNDRTLIGVEPQEYARLKAKAEQADELRAALAGVLEQLDETGTVNQHQWAKARAALAKETSRD